MFLDRDEWIQYIGYSHLNPVALGARDPDDMEDPDLAGLERILYDPEYLGIVRFHGINPYDNSELADEVDNETENNYEAPDYEAVDVEFNPFEYEINEEDEEDILPLKYSVLVDEENQIPGNELIDEEDPPMAEIDDLEEPEEEPELLPAASLRKNSDYAAPKNEAA